MRMVAVLNLHEQYYWLSSHRNMIGYSLYSLNARPSEARSRQLVLREVPLYAHSAYSHCHIVREAEFHSSYSKYTTQFTQNTITQLAQNNAAQMPLS